MTTTIADPAGSTKLYPWFDRNGQPARYFCGSSWQIEPAGRTSPIAVLVDGTQVADLSA